MRERWLCRDDTWKKQYAPYFLSLQRFVSFLPGFSLDSSQWRGSRSMDVGSLLARPQCLSTSVSEIFPLERASAIDVTPGSLLLLFFFLLSPPLLPKKKKNLSTFLRPPSSLVIIGREEISFHTREERTYEPTITLFFPSSSSHVFTLPFIYVHALVPPYIYVYMSISIHPPASPPFPAGYQSLGFLRHALRARTRSDKEGGWSHARGPPLFHSGLLCRTRSFECGFLHVFVSEARNSVCPLQLPPEPGPTSTTAPRSLHSGQRGGVRGVIPA